MISKEVLKRLKLEVGYEVEHRKRQLGSELVTMITNNQDSNIDSVRQEAFALEAAKEIACAVLDKVFSSGGSIQ